MKPALEKTTAWTLPKMIKLPLLLDPSETCSCCGNEANYECEQFGKVFCSYDCRQKAVDDAAWQTEFDRRYEISTGGEG